MDEREKLRERYDDAAFALMMDECAEADGEAFLAEFRAAAEAGEVPEIPADMDRLFRDTIKREYAGRERKVRFKQFKRAAARVAIAVFAVIGVLSTLILSVDALREPLFKYLRIEKETHTLIAEEIPRQDFHLASVSLFEQYLPDGYELVSDAITENMTMVVYECANDVVAQLYIMPAGGNTQLDTEDAVCTEIIVGEYKALLIEEGPSCMVFWENEKYHAFYTVQATIHDGLSTEAVLEICEALAGIE